MPFRSIVPYCLAAACWMTLAAPTARAQDAAPLVRMLKGGKLPPERIGNVLKLVLERGNAEDLAFVFERAAQPDAFPAEARLSALAGLAAAAETRKVLPEFNAATLGKLVADQDPALSNAALRLAGAWRAESLVPTLSELAVAKETPVQLRQKVLEALANIGGPAAQSAATKLLAAPEPELRVLGVRTLAAFDLEQALPEAVKLFVAGAAGEQTGELLAPFLERQGATDKLAAQLEAAKIGPDPAKLALRYLYAAGRSDAALVGVLSAAAGLNAEPAVLDAEQLKALSAEVLAKGDPHRGEQIFRRADLSCFKCHALSGAGGDIGPDLSPVGSTSPPDYIITSILNPDLSIKENFITRAIVTDAGKVYQGIVADRDDQRVILKEATGDKVTIPTADIVDEVEGKSLMPKGLAGFLTHQEFLDLVRFVSALGKPGEYEIRSKPTVQRWRVLQDVPPALTSAAPDAAAIRDQLLAAPESQWSPAYAQVAGVLPLAELAGRTGSAEPARVLYLRADLDVTVEGPIQVQLDDARGVQAWLDEQPLNISGQAEATVSVGPHKLLLRVDLTQRGAAGLTALVDKAHGSTAAVTIVGGR